VSARDESREALEAALKALKSSERARLVDALARLLREERRQRQALLDLRVIDR